MLSKGLCFLTEDFGVILRPDVSAGDTDVSRAASATAPVEFRVCVGWRIGTKSSLSASQ